MPKRFKKYVHNSCEIKFNVIKPIYPPPGFDLIIPNWQTKYFLEKIGMGCE
jgi:hypothetical protein